MSKVNSCYTDLNTTLNRISERPASTDGVLTATAWTAKLSHVDGDSQTISGRAAYHCGSVTVNKYTFSCKPSVAIKEKKNGNDTDTGYSGSPPEDSATYCSTFLFRSVEQIK